MTAIEPKPTAHPARWSASVLDGIEAVLADFGPSPERFAELPSPKMFDPYAGTLERLHTRFSRDWNVFGSEIEFEWADQHPNTIHGDCVEVMKGMAEYGELVTAVVTSPTYGNRMADQSMLPGVGAGARHTYNTYAFKLGKRLSALNTGATQWDNKTGRSYRRLHRAAWAAAWEIIEPGGLLIVNVSDHIRGGEVAPVVAWHRDTITNMRSVGGQIPFEVKVDTPRQRQGANGDLRVECEWILMWRKPDVTRRRVRRSSPGQG